MFAAAFTTATIAVHAVIAPSARQLRRVGWTLVSASAATAAIVIIGLR